MKSLVPGTTKIRVLTMAPGSKSKMLERFSRCESIMLDLTYHELMMDETVSNGAVHILKILSKKHMIKSIE